MELERAWERKHEGWKRGWDTQVSITTMISILTLEFCKNLHNAGYWIIAEDNNECFYANTPFNSGALRIICQRMSEKFIEQKREFLNLSVRPPLKFSFIALFKCFSFTQPIRHSKSHVDHNFLSTPFHLSMIITKPLTQFSWPILKQINTLRVLRVTLLTSFEPLMWHNLWTTFSLLPPSLNDLHTAYQAYVMFVAFIEIVEIKGNTSWKKMYISMIWSWMNFYLCLSSAATNVTIWLCITWLLSPSNLHAHSDKVIWQTQTI